MKVFNNQRKIAASSKEIFKAFKDLALFSKWWGPNGTNYPNEIIFQEITEPNKIVMRHSVKPYFTATVTIEDVEGGAVVNFHQDFDSEEVAKNIAHIVKPANEQVLDKLQALVAQIE